MRFLVLAPLLLALGQAALAAESTATPGNPAVQSVSVAASAVAESDAPKVTCHQEASAGSMMLHKVCTRVQTEAERNAAQEAMRQNLPNNSIAHPAAGSQMK